MTGAVDWRRNAHFDITALFQRASKFSSILTMLIGGTVLLGWHFGSTVLTGSCGPDIAPMSVREAIAFIFAGLSLRWIQARSLHLSILAQGFAIAIISLGVLQLYENFSGWKLNQWLAPESIASSTALCFTLVGIALLLSNRSEAQVITPWRTWFNRIAQVITLIAALIALESLVSNVHPIGFEVGQSTVPTRIALLSALTFLILAIGIQSLHLDQATMRVISISDRSSAGMVCQLLLAGMVIALIEVFFALWTQWQNQLALVYISSLLIVKTTVIFTLLIGWSVSLLTRIQQDYQQAEAVLEHSETWLELAQQAAGLGRWDLDLLTHQLRWCAQQEMLFGIAPGTFDGTYEAFLDRIHPDDRAIAERNLIRTLEARLDYYDEFRVVGAENCTRWILSRGRCFYDATGQPVRLSGVSLDVTESRLLQEERNRLLKLEQTARARAEAANRMKDEFLAILSHEIRTPLNSVLGWSRLLRSHWGLQGETRSLDPAMLARGIEALERNAEVQAQILEDLLDTARAAQGNLRLTIAPLRLVEIIADAIATIQSAADAKNIQITADLDCDASTFIGDQQRLQQVVWNLLSNAVKFTPSGGQVKVSLRRDNAEIEIEVSDTGKGISSEFLPFVFDRFRQEDSTLTRWYGGLGLGLSLVRYLVELHGGTVEAESPGLEQGATFRVKLPNRQIESITNTDRNP